jgi:hypothetical protein
MWEESGYVLSDVFGVAKSDDVVRFSVANTIPSDAKIPMHVPALLIASMAYST